MEVLLLGPLSVVSDEGGPLTIGGRRQRTLLALLALRPGVTMRTDRLIDEVWFDRAPRQPANALQIVVFKLRKAIGADHIVTTPTGYVLDLEPDAVDAHRFERLVGHGRAALAKGHHDDAADAFTEALALWRDDALVEFADAPSATAAAARWHELRATVAEDRFDARLALGHDAQLVAELGDAIAANPYRERLRGQLMVALFRSGRQAEALRAFADARRTLADELGLEPGAELRALQQAILDQDPAIDPRLASPVPRPLTRDEHPVHPAAVRVGATPLCGRLDELAALASATSALSSRRGGLTLIGGEPGIGKTRLLEEVTADVRTDGTAVVTWGRCHAGRGAPPFWPWIQIIRELLDDFDAATIHAAVGARAGELAQLVPEIKLVVPDVSTPAPLDPDAARFRLADAIASFVRALSRTRPMLVALDDLQWADASSLEVLSLATSGAQGVPLRIMGTFRTPEPTATGPLVDMLPDLARLPAVDRIELAGLDEEAVAELVTNGDVPMDGDAVAALVHRTLGNPFYVTEIVKLLATVGAADVAVAVQRSVPDSVRGVVRQRLDHLPADTVELLTAAAILGQDLDPGLLATMTSLGAAAILDRLQPAIDAAVLVPLGGHAIRYAFSHGLVAETIARGVMGAERARLHARAARALEVHHRDAPGPHLIPIAEHWLQAMPVASADDAIDAALRASRWAMTHVAQRQAEEQLHIALDLVSSIDDERLRAVRELELLDQLTLVLITGAGYQAPGLPELCDRLRALSHVAEDRNLLLGAMWRLSVYYCTVVDIDAALGLGQDLLERGAREHDPLIRLTAHMALSTPNILRADLASAQLHLDAALELCRDGHADALREIIPETAGVWSRSFSGWNTWLLGDAQRAEQLSRAAIAVGDAEGATSYAACVALCLASWVAALERDAPLARERSADGIARATAAGYEVRLFMMIVEGWATAALGDNETGRAEISDVSEAMHAAGATMLRPFHFALLADIDIAAARFDVAIEQVDRGIAIATSTGERWCEAELHRLRAAALAGRGASPGDVRHELERAVEIAARQSAGGFLARARADLTRLDR